MFNCDGAILFGLLLSAMSTVHLYVCQVAHERGFHSFPFFHFFLVWAFTCFALHLIPPASAHSTRNLNWVLGEEITSRAAALEAALEAASFPFLVHQPQVALIVSFPSSFILKSMSLLFLSPSSRLLWFPIRGLEEG